MDSASETAHQSLYVQATDTIEVMRKVLAEHLGIVEEHFEFDRSLDSLGLDSLSFVEYLFEVENALNITLPDLPPDLKSIGELVLFVDTEFKKQADGRDA